VERALDILEILSTERGGLGVSRIADMVGLHKSTAHRLLKTLTERGYAEKTSAGTYRIGLKLMEVVSVYINSLELLTEARPYVARITADLNLTAHLGILEGDQVVYIERMDAYSVIKLYAQIGIRVHAYCSSLGKCLLSNFSRDELDKVLENCSFERFTPNTITSRDEMHEELKKVRQRGWAIDDQEFDINNRCIGAPIYDYRGEIIAAVSASGTPAVLTDDRIRDVADYVKNAAAEISHNLGYAG
jgi:DNA-binding IclR family transcriptional regulator